MQLIKSGNVGAVRLLPFKNSSIQSIENNKHFFTDRFSNLGLAVNLIELDRFSMPYITEEQGKTSIQLDKLSREEIISYLEIFDKNWTCSSEQKNC